MRARSTKRTQRWSRHVHTKSGALRGWCERCPAAKRHSALRSVVRSDGYAVAVRRLNFLKNVANRRNNRGLVTKATQDLRWTRKNFGSSRA
jgi:hypothetical protein